MIFFCLDCQIGLVETGRVNCLFCQRCKSIYEVEIHLTKLMGEQIPDDIRQLALPEHSQAVNSAESSIPVDSSGGSGSSR